MFTSLLKIGLLSFITCITPLKAVSSDLDHTADSEVSFKSDLKKNIIVHDDTYYSYYIDLNSVKADFYKDFSLTSYSAVNDYSYPVTYSLNGNVLTFNATRFYSRFVQGSDTAYEYVFYKAAANGADLLVIDLFNKNLYVDIRGVKTVDYIQFPYQTANFALNLGVDLADYDYQRNRIFINRSELNTRYFPNLANYLYEHRIVLTDLISLEYLGQQVIFDYPSSNLYVKGVYAQDNGFNPLFDVRFYLSGNNYGLWVNNQINVNNFNVGQFSEGAYLYVYNVQHYENIKYCIDLDLGNNISSFKNEFHFYDNFNYNSVYPNTDRYYYVVDDYFVQGVDSKYIDLSFPTFNCNGQYFNTIRLKFNNAYGSSYYIVDQDKVVTFTDYGYGYFDSMYYIYYTGSLQDTPVKVNDRVFNIYLDNEGNITEYITDDIGWYSNVYKNLYFVNDLSVNQANTLTNFNSLNGTDGLTGAGGIDLNNTFSLINTGFGGLINLLSVNVLPGITLGTLIFVPFAVTILLFVVKLFKR